MVHYHVEGRQAEYSADFVRSSVVLIFWVATSSSRWRGAGGGACEEWIETEKWIEIEKRLQGIYTPVRPPGLSIPSSMDSFTSSKLLLHFQSLNGKFHFQGLNGKLILAVWVQQRVRGVD